MQIQRRQQGACDQMLTLGCAAAPSFAQVGGAWMGVSCSSAVNHSQPDIFPARIFSATLTMAEESTSEQRFPVVCLHRVEVPVAIKDAAILAADAAMDKYSTEKVIYTLRCPSPFWCYVFPCPRMWHLDLKRTSDVAYGGTWNAW